MGAVGEREPLVLCAGEVLQEQQRKPGAIAEAAIGIALLTYLQKLGRRSDVTHCHKELRLRPEGLS